MIWLLRIEVDKESFLYRKFTDSHRHGKVKLVTYIRVDNNWFKNNNTGLGPVSMTEQ